MNGYSCREAWPAGRQSLILICFLLLITAASAPFFVADAAPRRQLQLSLREATALALQQNLDIQIAGITPQIRQAQITEERGIFDPVVQSDLRASSNKLLTDSSTIRCCPVVDVRETPVGTIGLAAQEDTQEQELSVGLSQLTPYGGTYGIEASGLHTDTNARLFDNFDDETRRVDHFTSALELRVTQPLLRNFGKTVTQNQILIAQNNYRISAEDFRSQVINATSQVQQSYWDLVFRRQDLNVRTQQRDLAQRLLAQVRRQVEVGTLAPIEVLQAETNIATVNQRIIIAANAVRGAEDRLKRAMNLSLIGEFADVEILPTDTPVYRALQIDQEQEIGAALENRYDLIQERLALENQNISLVFSKNQVLPTLDLEGSFGLNGLNDNFGSSLEEFNTDRHRWQVGLVFRYPLGNRQAKSRLQQNRLAIRQQLLQIKELEETIMEEVRTAVRAVQASAELVVASTAASRLSQRQLEAEEKKLNVGLATVFTVLQFQDDLAVQRSIEIQSLTEHLKAIVQLEAAKNTLLQAYDIIIQDYSPRLPQ